jgi:glucokinase
MGNEKFHFPFDRLSHIPLMEPILLADIGGTYFRYRLEEGENVHCPVEGWEDRLITILDMHPEIRRVGIAFAGQVSEGKIRSAPNVAVSHPDIKELLEERFSGLSVAIDNDLKCAALAYQNHLDADSVAVLYTGSGLGSALISEGRIVRGRENMAGEIGHVSYRRAPFRCGCGKDDCLELFASGSGIEKHRRHFHLSDRTPDEWLVSPTDAERQTAADMAEALAFAASLLITLHNPAFLVIGGGVWEHNPLLRRRVKEMILPRTFPPARRGCRILDADLKDAPMIGAGLLFRQDFWLK